MMDWVRVSASQNHMACTFELDAWVHQAEADRVQRILGQMHEQVSQWEREWSEFNPDSPVRGFNEAAVGTRIELSASGAQLLNLSLEYEKQTRGAFSAFAKGRPTKILDWSGRWLRKSEPQLHLGFGAIGKGYAIDLIRLQLDQEGIENYRLDAGGSSLYFRGQTLHEGRFRSWRMAWKTSVHQGLPLECIQEGLAVGVSGIEEKGEHVIGDKVFEGARLFSTIAVGHDAARADAYSTAALATNASLEFLETMADYVPSFGFAYADCNQQIKCNNVMSKWLRATGT